MRDAARRKSPIPYILAALVISSIPTYWMASHYPHPLTFMLCFLVGLIVGVMAQRLYEANNK